MIIEHSIIWLENWYNMVKQLQLFPIIFYLN